MSDHAPLDAARAEMPTSAPAASPAGTDPSPVPLAGRPARRRGRRALAAFGAVIVSASIFSAGAGVGAGIDRAGLLAGSAGATASPAHADSADLALIGEAWDLLHQKYVDASSLDSQELAHAAIGGMTEAIGDTGHTAFLTPSELAASEAALSGSYAGIGAEMDTTGSEPVVVGVFRGSPAAEAGLRRGDVIVAVDGTSTAGQSLERVISRVRGAAGSAVTLSIRRLGAADPLTLRIVRADVEIPAVEWATVPGTSIVDFRIEQFSSGATEDVVTALKAALATDPTGMVLDLRGNPGGYVNEAVGVASQFLAGGDVYRQRDASGAESATPVSPGGIATDIPLVVLVDGGTASSAEIVTGALQDAGRATVIGEKTFGTGTVLGRFSLADGSALRIGTVEWLTPKGRRIWHEGLVPGVVVPLADSASYVMPSDLSALGASGVADSPDTQLRKALEILTSRPTRPGGGSN